MNEEQRAERLRLYMNRIGELEADNERLREQVAALQATSGYEASIAQVENERLRAALQEIADFPYVGTQASQKIWGIARRALEPKPFPQEPDVEDGM